MSENGELRYVCTFSDPYDRFALDEWVRGNRDKPQAPATVRVLHPDREADGSCRWCGESRDDVVTLQV